MLFSYKKTGENPPNTPSQRTWLGNLNKHKSKFLVGDDLKAQREGR